MSEFWMDTGRFTDFTNSANRAKFHTLTDGVYLPVSLGTDGSTPFGAAPVCYYTGGSTNFITNRGSLGGTLLVDGTIYNIITV